MVSGDQADGVRSDEVAGRLQLWPWRRIGSVRWDVAGPRGKNAQMPLRFLPCILDPCRENRRLEGGMGLEESR